MANSKPKIQLTDSERTALLKFVASGSHPAMMIRRAEIILALDTSDNKAPLTAGQAAARFHVSMQAVYNMKREFLSSGLDEYIRRKKRSTPPVPQKVDGELEAHIIALCCSDPPEGYARWSVRLLADKCVELNYVDSISHMTISRALKKTSLSLI